MVDISLEILASSVPLKSGHVPRYRVKTWWAHIEVPPDVTFIKLPRLPMLQPFLIMTGKDTTVFVETWQDHRSAIVGSGGGDGGIAASKTSFSGLTKCTVDEQLKTPSVNPSVQWLDVHDPIEDVSRGKLLVKIDAKYIGPEEMPNGQSAHSPARSENRHSHRGGDLHNDSPIKMMQSPRRSNLGANFPVYDYTSSPAVQSVASRKSDTSVFSVHSVSSTRSQEQAVQTDLSLPIIPDITKYTAGLGLNLRSSLGDDRKGGGGAAKKPNSGSDSSIFSAVTAVPATPSLVDPLKYAEEILMRSVQANKANRAEMQRRTSEPAPQSNSNKHPASLPTSNSSNSAFRRSCLVRQHVQQQELSPSRTQQGSAGVGDRTNLEQRNRHSKNYDLESLGDVIDMLNNDNSDLDLDGSFVSSNNITVINNGRKRTGSGSSNNNAINTRGQEITSSSSGKPPLPSNTRTSSKQQQGGSTAVSIPGITKLRPTGEVYSNRASHLQRESISSTCSSLNQYQRQQSSSSPVNSSSTSATIDRIREDNRRSSSPSTSQTQQQQLPANRFKEIHFDGNQAKQQATSILMTRTTAPASSSNPPVVTRRRIAAAIFND